MTNFDFLKSDAQFSAFANAAIAAERVYQIDVPTCVLNCRRALEFAVKWIYSVDEGLAMPYQDNLVSLMNTREFQDLLDDRNLWRRMDSIRKMGNVAAHSAQKLSKGQAQLALENLFYFMDFVACCYSSGYQPREFDKSLLEAPAPTAAPTTTPEVDLKALMAENESLRAQLTARRTEQEKNYVSKPLDLTEYETRKRYIDTMLQDADWTEGVDWISEYPLEGMPSKSGEGFADYVLFGSDGRPLAVLEAKRTCKDVAVGRQQAKLYADLLEQKFGRRPVIFLSNGFDTRIWNDRYYNERPVSGIYAKRDLEKEFNKLTIRTHLDDIQISNAISDYYYQKEAIRAVCEAFDRENRRKALLVMATGSGKTRTVISLVDVLLRHGWVKNVLFLADRNSLVTQAKRAFTNFLPDLSVINLCEDKEHVSARAVFSTYQTMMGCIDDVRDEAGGKLFTVGHFDLIIVDEAHRSIYRKYQDIFNYFDAHLVGLTATPRDEIDKNTYGIFELEEGVPTYGYELDQAVQDGYLVDFRSLETTLKFPSKGIAYDELSADDREQYEDSFTDENGDLPDRIESAALNEWVFNEDTIRKALDILMTQGIRVDYGNKLGKTIIFAKNHRHAEKICEVFNREYPACVGWARVIDNYTNYAQSAIDEFSTPDKLPQIAISVDMLDTGIDVRDIVNLVFFKKVMSKSKFWQMIGRGTRLCPGLLDGKDKECFYIFDFCDNFAFFRVNPKGKEAALQTSLQERIFNLKSQIVLRLQELEYQTEELAAFRKNLVAELLNAVRGLRELGGFAVRQHLRYVERFSDPEAYTALTYENTLQLEELAPLLPPSTDEATAVQFDSLMYGIELAYLVGKTYTKARKDLMKKIRAVADVSNIPAINTQKAFLDQLLHTDYVESAGINEFEQIREAMRDLIKYIPLKERHFVETDLADEIVSMEWHESELESHDLDSYKKKVNYYIRQHQDELVIAKLHSNQPLTEQDVEQLERILWSEVGTKEEYQREYGAKPLGELVREIVGLDMNAAKAAFSQYLGDVNLDQRQSYFVNQIINYIVRNGLMKDLSVLQDTPFTAHGSVVEIFTDMNVWMKVRKVIESINANAVA
ncbi:DEAD/DEAH box helicase family protein [Oscillibacter sp. MSJ-2]|uniref:DEAD/DEAH box helicase family protein n=1 Tax=Dysosmobacter acutus TaxID=2841504 RepID=A0ABS6FDG9_9FIRM|nr:DEAD/DEAH box helicase family protein [Dysosmobacter acutus]MBU5627671.1 DEAD/DEAH box helicase family protein [Dysosmobacter acutus]